MDTQQHGKWNSFKEVACLQRSLSIYHQRMGEIRSYLDREKVNYVMYYCLLAIEC